MFSDSEEDGDEPSREFMFSAHQMKDILLQVTLKDDLGDAVRQLQKECCPESTQSCIAPILQWSQVKMDGAMAGPSKDGFDLSIPDSPNQPLKAKEGQQLVVCTVNQFIITCCQQICKNVLHKRCNII
jgi:hypothetical protein